MKSRPLLNINTVNRQRLRVKLTGTKHLRVVGQAVPAELRLTISDEESGRRSQAYCSVLDVLLSDGNCYRQAQPALRDWWSGSTEGLVRGLGGAVMGLTGTVIGVLTGLGKGKKLVLALSGFIAVTGGFALICGIVAISTRQSYNVFYPLLLMGSMMVVAGTICLCLAPAQFRNPELRRMQAMDLN